MHHAPFSFTANLSGMYNLNVCMFTLYLCLGLNGGANVITNSERTVLQWDQMPNTGYPDCITSYSIGWNGTTYNTSDTAISVTRELLSASGFPFCTTIHHCDTSDSNGTVSWERLYILQMSA